MKKILFLLLIQFSVSTLFGQGFVVKKYTADISVNKNGWFDVTEKYDVDFTEYKHGLLRSIITKYKLDGKERKIFIKDIKVPGHKFSATPGFIEKLSGEIELKIGDKDKTIIGPQHYEISYRVENAILFVGDKAELYWNVIPQGWNTVFEKVEINVNTPEGSKLSGKNCFVYAGNIGDTTPSNDFSYNYSDHKFSANSNENVNYYMGQSVTVLVKVPKELVKEVDYSPSGFAKYGWLGILAIIFGYFFSLWQKYGKDDTAIALTSYYPPKGIDSAMAGYLINDREDSSDLISLLPKWGHDGLIRIEEIPKTGIFGKTDNKIYNLKELPDTAPNYERTMFDGLFEGSTVIDFDDILTKVSDAITGTHTEDTTEESHIEGVLVSSLKDSFYVTMNLAKSELKEGAKIYYEPKSDKMMTRMVIYSVLGLILVSGIFLFVFGLIAAGVSFILFLIMIIYSGFMRKKTKTGTEILSQLKGFKQFIKLAETNRIKTLIEQDPDYFEKTMSYALSFGLLKQWAAKFDALDIRPPEWYTGSTMGAMSMSSFSNSFASSMASTQSAMISSPSSSGSGGGSSGGGFGGGGGGSW